MTYERAREILTGNGATPLPKTVAALFRAFPHMWTQGADLNENCQMCLRGAYRLVYGDLGTRAATGRTLYGSFLDVGNGGVVDWNDKRGRTVEEVIAMADRLGI